MKSEDTQALHMIHKAREFLVRQQTQIMNAMRAHLGEFGIVVPKGIQNVERLIMACEQASFPAAARKALNLLSNQLLDTQKEIEDLTADIRADAKANQDAQRLQTIPASARSPQARSSPRCPILPNSRQAAICRIGWA